MKNDTELSHIDNTRVVLHRQSIAFYGILTFFFILVIFVETDSAKLNTNFFAIIVVFLIISVLWISLRNKVKSLHEITLYLQNRSNEYDVYFNSGIDMLCIINDTGTIIRINPGWEQFLGISRSELEGSSLFSILHPDDLEKIKIELMKRSASDNKVRHFTARFRYADESYRRVECKFTFNNGSLLIASHDISEYVKNGNNVSPGQSQKNAFAESSESEVKSDQNRTSVNYAKTAYTMGNNESKRIIFDYDGFMRRIMNDNTLAQSVLNVFINDIPVQFKALKEYSLSGNSDMILHQAHTIKGTAGNIGAEELRQTAAAIETAARSGDLSGVTDLIYKLDTQLKDLLDQISIRLQSLNHSKDGSL